MILLVGGTFSILIQVACGLMMVKYWCHIFDAIKDEHCLSMCLAITV